MSTSTATAPAPYPLLRGSRTNGVPRLRWTPLRQGIPVASARGLAAHHGVSARTARRWLLEGRVRTAFRAPERWWVPTYELNESRRSVA